VMTCFAADARPASLLLAGTEELAVDGLAAPRDLGDGTWVAAVGRLEDPGPPLPALLRLERLEPVDEPEDPYLHLNPLGW